MKHLITGLLASSLFLLSQITVADEHDDMEFSYEEESMESDAMFSRNTCPDDYMVIGPKESSGVEGPDSGVKQVTVFVQWQYHRPYATLKDRMGKSIKRGDAGGPGMNVFLLKKGYSLTLENRKTKPTCVKVSEKMK